MTKKVNKTMVITTLLCMVPLVISAFFYHQLPDTVATHWDLNGEANGYSPKFFAAFGLPGILLLLNLLTQFIMDADPKRGNTPRNMRNIAKWFIPVLSIFIQVIVLFNALSTPFNIGPYLMLFMGILFVILGNYLPKCKQNYTVGIKIPWTLNDEENWNKTHRLAGFVWVIGGLIVAVTSFFSIPWILFTVLIIMVLIPSVYSYLLYKKKNH